MSITAYTPPPSLAPYLISEDFVDLVVGPVGSGKTTASIIKIAYHAARMAACRDGVRRSRCVVIRNTTEQLRDTTIPDFLKFFPDGVAGSFLKTEKKFTMRFADVECEVLFRGLDDQADVRRLLSLQASFAFMDEFREIHPDVFSAMTGRLGRYPDHMMVPNRPEWGVDEKGNPIGGCVRDDGVSNKHIWGSTNPPDMDSYWENYISKALDGGIRGSNAWVQPSGLSPEADWIQYLPQAYYEDLIEGKTPEYVDVYVHAKFGKSLSGRPVWPTYRDDYHVAKEPITPLRMEGAGLLIGHDFGLTPAAVIGQLDAWGRLLILAECVSDGMGALQFVRQKLKPLLASRFPGYPVTVIGDPAGQQRAQTDERTVFDILRAERLRVIPARTNSVIARVSAVDAFLARQVDGGKPLFLVDPACVNLRRAMRGGYRYKVKKGGEVDDSPEKNMYSHISDALQYLCLHADGGKSFGGARLSVAARPVIEVSSAGWT